MIRLVLIRHGQTEWNKSGRYQGQSDVKLSEEGLAQARCLAEHFPVAHLDAVYASDLTRAVLTAKGIADRKGLPVLKDPRLRELDLGPWESQFFGNIRHNFPEESEVFMHDPGSWKIAGAETAYDVIDRAYPALLEILDRHPDQSLAIVSHGVTIRCLLTRILNRSFAPDELLPIFQNTAVTKLLYDRGNFTVEYMGDASHLDSIILPDWISIGALRDEPFNPENDPSFYKACYADAWKVSHQGSLERFDANVYYEAAVRHHKKHPGAVQKLFDGETCVGLVDCDTERGAHANYGWISLLYLTEDYRGKGYGVQAFARALVLYRNLGRRSIRLHAAATNEQAVRFYEKLGFSILATEPGTVGQLYLMEKRLEGQKDVR